MVCASMSLSSVPEKIGPVLHSPLRILVVWEPGANLGHLLRLPPVVKALMQKGHAVVLLLVNIRKAQVGAAVGNLQDVKFKAFWMVSKIRLCRRSHVKTRGELWML